LDPGIRVSEFDGGFSVLTGTEQGEHYSFDDAESSPLMRTILGYNTLDGKVFGETKCLVLSRLR